MHKQFEDSPLAVLKRSRISPGRALCLFLYYVVARHLVDTPLPGCGAANWIRRKLCRHIFKHLGNNTSIHSRVTFGTGSELELGDGSSLNEGCWIANDTRIGRDVMMGPQVVILSSSHNFSDPTIPMRLQGAPPRRPVTIGDDVWIGTRVIILPGLFVGSHAIIGAGSVVTKDIAPWKIVAGNPAREIGSRLHEPETEDENMVRTCQTELKEAALR